MDRASFAAMTQGIEAQLTDAELEAELAIFQRRQSQEAKRKPQNAAEDLTAASPQPNRSYQWTKRNTWT